MIGRLIFLKPVGRLPLLSIAVSKLFFNVKKTLGIRVYGLTTSTYVLLCDIAINTASYVTSEAVFIVTSTVHLPCTLSVSKKVSSYFVLKKSAEKEKRDIWAGLYFIEVLFTINCIFSRQRKL